MHREQFEQRPNWVWHLLTAPVGCSEGPRGDTILQVLYRAQQQPEPGPGHKPQASFILLNGSCHLGTGHQELPYTSCPCPPGLRPNQRPVSGRKARDFLKTQGHKAVRKRLGAVHGGAAPGHAELPAPRPPARRGSLQTPEPRLAPGSPTPAQGCSQALADTLKG